MVARKFSAVSAVSAALVLSGCFFGEEEEPGNPAKPAYSGPCVDVSADARAKADAYVADGNAKMAENFDYWFSRSDDWWEAKRNSPEQALAAYDNALAAAPGDCRAVFGRAMASASMITQDKRMDDFVRKVENTPAPGSGNVVEKRASYAALFKMSPDDAAPAPLKLNAKLEKVDRVTLQDVQTLIETVIMPKLDSTIAALETVMDYSMFAIRFGHEGDTVEIDRGEVGPGLAGLKVAKAWLTLVAGYNLDIGLDGKYDWMDTLAGLDMADYDRLTPGQTRALDHLTGMFKTGSQVTRMKPAWKPKINAIPDLLISAAGDAQKGLQSVIEEARSGDPQTYDIWRAGSGEDADVDVVDLERIIELLERSKKYFRGDVPLTYDKGTQTITVNFKKIFEIDGLQGLLPHFKFYPYAEWNDTVSADTSWTAYFGESQRRALLAAMGYPEAPQSYYLTWQLSIQDTLALDSGVYRRSPRWVRFYPVSDMGSPSAGIDVAVLAADPANPCELTFTKRLDVVADPMDPGRADTAAVSGPASGRVSIPGCRLENGQAMYAAYVYADTKGPIYFTTPDGTKTADPLDLDDDTPAALKGKVYFQDPTFGGVLPGLTNDNIWDKFQSLEKVEPRVYVDCPETDPYTGETYVRKCKRWPNNPSDLDYLVYYLDWSDLYF